MSEYHIPVLLDACLETLNVHSGGVFLDCTMGGGGHSSAMAKLVGSTGLVIGVDRDQDAIDEVLAHRSDVTASLQPVKVNFGNFPYAMDKCGVSELDGILMDIGVSSHQFDAAERGFSYRFDAPLDMRMDRASGRSAADILNEESQDEIQRILRDYGEVRNSYRMATHICKARKKKLIETTGDFVSLLNEEYGDLKNSVLSKVFQAFRIEVNGELTELESALNHSLHTLKIGGRVAVISYHSLEDRIVKNFFREKSVDCICPSELPLCQCGGNNALLKVVTRKPILATDEEIGMNVRARSAKLRVAERIK